jgi:uncharacterized protein (DUF433 family)/virulence-associated protein VagC
MVGKPVIKGTRITVELILRMLGQGHSPETILDGYPHLTREDILAAQAFAAEYLERARFALTEAGSANKRTVRSFRRGEAQAVPIPREWEFESQEVGIRRLPDGKLVLTCVEPADVWTEIEFDEAEAFVPEDSSTRVRAVE